ncbi:antitoxin [Arthrobacter sp. MYb227]|uniref:antitoxin n=1 Tax=Arthrobacter sp. MYb227 TaxID=1848601 RepID=UPI000CFD491D|nr:antitoxin [Arthrobacter sp. MYb227]PQZ95791.1 antitoxin [Arthrobacter sp. MYb227]
MSIFDELKGKAEELKDKAADLIQENSEKITGAIDQAGDFIDEKTGGKFADKVDKVQDGAKGLLDKVDGDDQAPTA